MSELCQKSPVILEIDTEKNRHDPQRHVRRTAARWRGYLHDLIGLLVSQTVYQGMWRWHRQTTMSGNLYPTHGIGPMSWCMDINRGDAFDYMV
jgi:hypothetical protein